MSYDARKNAARDLARRTGMPYTAALRHLEVMAQPRQPRHRWVLSDDVHAFLAGESWRGLYYEDLYGWLDRLKPVFECDWCGEPADARREDVTIRLTVTSYDPDLSPSTRHIFTHKHHARCQPSAIAWVQAADVPHDPYELRLTAAAKPEISGAFALRAITVVDDEPTAPAVLLLAAEVIDDAGQGAAPWLNELQFVLSANGFGPVDGIADEHDNGWTLRIVDDYPSRLAPQWIALHIGPVEDSVPVSHLYLATLDLPAAWVARARHLGEVQVLVGPIPVGNDVPELPAQLDVDGLDELIDDDVVTTCRIRVAVDPTGGTR